MGEGVKPVSDDNIGAQMLRKLGWEGGGLGNIAYFYRKC